MNPTFIEIIGFGSQGWGPVLLFGAVMTLAVALCGLLFGLAIGTLGAWAKLAGGRALRHAADVYTTVLRGVPDLLVIYLFYFGSASLLTAAATALGRQGYVDFPGFLAGALAIGFTSGAQNTEVLRGAFQAVHKGELEAALVCGMSRPLRFRRIVVPLVLRHALPGLGNVWLTVLKESSLVSVTGVAELMREAQVGAGSTRLPFDFYIAAAGLYAALALGSSGITHFAERHYARGLRRS